MNERHDDLQEIIDAALREMAAEEGDGFDPQACNLAEFCRRMGLTRSRARTVRAHGFRALFFDVVDRRYEKEGPNAMVLTSNIAPSGWDEFFTGDDTLLCALDRLFDKASVFVMRGPSYRGRELDTYSVEAVPQAVKVRGIQPEGM